MPLGGRHNQKMRAMLLISRLEHWQGEKKADASNRRSAVPNDDNICQATVLILRTNLCPVIRRRACLNPHQAGRQVGHEDRQLPVRERIALEPGTMERLTAYCWPGNIRQLQNVLEQAVINSGAYTLSETHIPLSETHIPTSVCPTNCRCALAAFGSHLHDGNHRLPPLKDAERQAIVSILRECGGNISRAACRIGISRVTLYKKIRKYEISLSRNCE